jgi:hypothetical protein
LNPLLSLDESDRIPAAFSFPGNNGGNEGTAARLGTGELASLVIPTSWLDLDQVGHI